MAYENKILKHCSDSWIKWLFFILLCCVTGLGYSEPALKPKADPLPLQMRKVFDAFTKLQPYIYSQDAFFSPNNDQQINVLLATLADNFHKVESLSDKQSQEPAFISTLQVLNEMLYDSLHRFKEGKKGYALWRVRTASTYCVTCHTRFESSHDFFNARKLSPKLSPLERGQFLLASRQYDKAAGAFLEVTLNPKFTTQRMQALRTWLLIYVRVHPDQKEAMSTLENVKKAIKPTRLEIEEIDDWITSLKNWSANPPQNIPPLELAEKLIKRGLHSGSLLKGRRGTVELLRATALLHKSLEDKPALQGEDRGEALYLLALAYNELPLFFANELPEMFLEQCIREFPESSLAKKAYRFYYELVSQEYTGSGGTSLPEDVDTQLKMLSLLAYG